MIIHGTGKLSSGTIDSNNDHRIAMAGGIAAVLTEDGVTVKDSEEEFLILIKEKGDIVEELILIGYETEDCCDEDSFFLLSLYGEIDLKGISDIGEALDIEELEKLEKMEDQ